MNPNKCNIQIQYCFIRSFTTKHIPSCIRIIQNKYLLYWIREPFIVNIVTAYYIVITRVWWPVDYDKCDVKR